MIEIRIHSRGGQGGVIAGKILAVAAFKEGKYVQTFPSFGVERRAAPVLTFIRLDDQPIRNRNQVYQPDHIVVMDPSLISATDITGGLKDGGWILLNTERDPKEFELHDRYQFATVNASAIAMRHQLGTRTQPIVNTAILGAVSRSIEVVKLDAVVEAIQEEVPANHEANMQAARDAFQETVLHNSK